MEAADVVEIIKMLDEASVVVWLDGGWAVDAVLKEQTRSHDDLDIVLSSTDVQDLLAALEPKGFAVINGELHSSFVLADATDRRIDAHVVTFDDDRNGIFQMPAGGEWIFPAAGFDGVGTVGGEGVRCLTPEVQMQCHANGYEWTATDLQDMRALRDRFGVELPEAYRQ
jgi:lincosamide nucleotidyltransferase A/C/D/E